MSINNLRDLLTAADPAANRDPAPRPRSHSPRCCAVSPELELAVPPDRIGRQPGMRRALTALPVRTRPVHAP
jgi:hypothetical protein